MEKEFLTAVIGRVPCRVMKTDIFVSMISCVLVGNLCTLRQSWFDGDDLVSFSIGYPRFFGVLDGYVRRGLCGADLKVSNCRLATFREYVRGKRQMLRGIASRFAHQMPSLTGDGMAISPRAVERRLRLVEGCPFPVMESMLEFIVAQAIEIEQ